MHEHEPAPARARQRALAHPRDERGRDARVHRRAARPQHAGARLGGQGMAGGNCAFHVKERKGCPHLANLKFRCTSTEEKARNVISTLAQIHARIGRRGFAAAALLLLALLAAVATPQLLGTRVAAALDTVGSADPTWLWLAGIGFAISVLAAAGSWRCAIGLCGGRLSVTDACARYGVGSLVNTIVPFRAGDAVRIGLFARVLPSEKRLWTTGGAFAALGAARAVVLGALVVAGYLAGAVPLWPLLIAVGLVAAAVVVAIVSRRSSAHLLDAFRSLAEEPSGAARLVAWLARLHRRAASSPRPPSAPPSACPTRSPRRS